MQAGACITAANGLEPDKTNAIMANYKVIGGDLKQYGPVSAEDLRKWIADGRLNAMSLVQPHGEVEWKPLSSFSEFADALAGKPATLSAPPPMELLGGNERQAALRRVKAPAVALMVTAILNMILVVAGWLAMMFFRSALEQFYSGMPNGAQIQKMLESANSPLAIIGNLLGLLLSVLILIGAAKMRSLRSYEFSVTAAIVAMLPCVTPCCLLGLPFGIWALIVLTRPEVKSQFH